MDKFIIRKYRSGRTIAINLDNVLAFEPYTKDEERERGIMLVTKFKFTVDTNGGELVTRKGIKISETSSQYPIIMEYLRKREVWFD